METMNTIKILAKFFRTKEQTLSSFAQELRALSLDEKLELAKLAASAPDLLRAAKATLSGCDEKLGIKISNEIWDGLDMLRDAVAKAEGKKTT